MGNHEIAIQKDLSHSVPTVIPAGVEIHRRAKSLPGQMCKIVWILCDRRIIAQ